MSQLSPQLLECYLKMALPVKSFREGNSLPHPVPDEFQKWVAHTHWCLHWVFLYPAPFPTVMVGEGSSSRSMGPRRTNPFSLTCFSTFPFCSLVPNSGTSDVPPPTDSVFEALFTSWVFPRAQWQWKFLRHLGFVNHILGRVFWALYLTSTSKPPQPQSGDPASSSWEPCCVGPFLVK